MPKQTHIQKPNKRTIILILKIISTLVLVWNFIIYTVDSSETNDSSQHIIL